MARKANPTARLDEFQRIQASVPIRFPTLQWDPRYLAIEAAFQRTPSNTQSVNAVVKSSPIQRLANSQGLVGWRAIGIQELQANRWEKYDAGQLSSLEGNEGSLYSIRRIESRPKLDARFVDQAWQTSVTMPLESVWIDDQLSACEVRMVHDDDFLFIAVACRRGTPASSQQQPPPPECLTFRFDTDRDYMTWFELQVDEAGHVTERCMDMESWQPEWYFKTETDDVGWRLEAAIPIAQLQTEPISSNRVWSFAIQRAIPNQGTQTNRAMYADRLLLTSPTLVRFCELHDAN